MKKILFGSLVVLSTCLTQEGIGTENLKDDKDTSSLTKLSSKIEEIKISDTDIEINKFFQTKKNEVYPDYLSSVIDTVNEVQTFLAMEKEKLEKFDFLTKEDFQNIALESPSFLMRQFRSGPINFVNSIQKRREIMGDKKGELLQHIGYNLYQDTLNGLNIISHIIVNCAD